MMNINFDKEQILVELDKMKQYSEEDVCQSYDQECDSDERLTKEEHEERIQNAIDFVKALTDDEILKSVDSMTKKKNGKPKKRSIVQLFVGDTGYWFVEWYVSYCTFRIVSRAIDENNLEVVLEKEHIING